VKTSPGSLPQRLVIYGLGAGAASIASQASQADGAILYSGPVEFSGNTIHFDLQNVVPPSSSFNSPDDFKMKSNTSSFVAKITGESVYGYNPQVVAFTQFGRNYVSKLALNQTIGGASDFYYYGYFRGSNHFGQWSPGERGFIGLRLTINNVDYFGWADVTLNNLNGVGLPVFTLHGYAFKQEPNESILAGQKVEGGKKKKKGRGEVVAPILLLLAGASGIAALKRRKKETSI
jgi:hypothetical protein